MYIFLEQAKKYYGLWLTLNIALSPDKMDAVGLNCVLCEAGSSGSCMFMLWVLDQVPIWRKVGPRSLRDWYLYYSEVSNRKTFSCKRSFNILKVFLLPWMGHHRNNDTCNCKIEKEKSQGWGALLACIAWDSDTAAPAPLGSTLFRIF